MMRGSASNACVEKNGHRGVRVNDPVVPVVAHSGILGQLSRVRSLTHGVGAMLFLVVPPTMVDQL